MGTKLISRPFCKDYEWFRTSRYKTRRKQRNVSATADFGMKRNHITFDIDGYSGVFVEFNEVSEGASHIYRIWYCKYLEVQHSRAAIYSFPTNNKHVCPSHLFSKLSFKRQYINLTLTSVDQVYGCFKL